MKRLFVALLVIACMIVAYLLAIMLDDPDRAKGDQWLVESERTELPALAAVMSQDGQALARAFGVAVPAFSSARVLSGTLHETQYAGGRAYLLTMDMEIGGASFTLTCARPADAASLLLRGGTALRAGQSLRSADALSVLSMPCVFASGERAQCLYFSSEDAAYSLYAEGMDEQAFLSLPALATGTLGGY